MHQNTEHSVCDTLLMVGKWERRPGRVCGGQLALCGDWVNVEAWPLLSREDRVATECTRDEQLPVLQGQVPLHKHMQGDLVVDQALPVAEDRYRISVSTPTPSTSLILPTYRCISNSRSSGLTVLRPA